MAGHKNTIWIPIERSRVLVYPGDGTSNLVGHRHQAASSILHVNKVDYHGMRTCTDKYFGGKCIADGPSKPGPTMDKNVDRCVWMVRHVNVETLDRRRSIFVTAWLPKPLAHRHT